MLTSKRPLDMENSEFGVKTVNFKNVLGPFNIYKQKYM